VTDILPNPTTHDQPDAPSGSVAVIFPTGMLGGGFPAETVTRGIALGADAIAVDGGSTDSGPHYLGTGTAKTAASAVERDLRVLLTEARAAGIPLIVTSCGTSGTDSGVDWIADMVTHIARQHHLSFRLARIYSALRADVPPGDYTVILEPAAVAALIQTLQFGALSKRAADEGRDAMKIEEIGSYACELKDTDGSAVVEGRRKISEAAEIF